MDVVFSLQKAGADHIFSYQFLLDTERRHSGSWDHAAGWHRHLDKKKRGANPEQGGGETLGGARETDDAALLATASAVAQSLDDGFKPPQALANLQSKDSLTTLRDVMMAWPRFEPVVDIEVAVIEAPAFNLALLDEDAILAAATLLLLPKGRT